MISKLGATLLISCCSIAFASLELGMIYLVNILMNLLFRPTLQNLESTTKLET
jgi:hypothetical protein